MKRLFTVFSFLFFFLASGQYQITLEDIWLKGTFRQEYLYGYTFAGAHDMIFSRFEHGKFYLERLDMSTGKVKDVLFSSEKQPDIRYVYRYEFSPNEQMMLLSVYAKPVYRHSSLEQYVIYDVKNNKIAPLDKDLVQIPSFFPDGERVVYVKDNNLYIKDLGSGVAKQITFDGEKNKVINGKTDWVYEEEFGFVKAYAVSRDGRYLAYLKFDEREVPEYTFMVYEDKLYPEPYTYKYPKAGEKNSLVTLHIYDMQTGKTKQADLGEYEYIPYIKRGRGASDFAVMTMNRLQNRQYLFLVEYGKKPELLVKREAEKYLDFERTNNLHFLKGGSFIWSSERDGYNHIYWYSREGKIKRQITKGAWEVTQVYGVDEKNQRIYYQSNESGVLNRAVYSVDFSGKHKQLLSPSEGGSSASFSKDFQYFLLQYNNAKEPLSYTIRDLKGKLIKTLKSNERLKKRVEDMRLPGREFVDFVAADGKTVLHGTIIYPQDFQKGRFYPLLIYGYNGPGYQAVRNSWYSYNDYWHMMLAQKGFIVVSVDTRGTGGRGRDFRQITYKQLGKYELEDLTAVLRQMEAKPYVDKRKTGIWGWSFGGFMATNALLQQPDLFDFAVAVAPVTNWRFYDTVYTERYMQTPQENPGGYDDNSPLSYAENLKGDLLLVHGTADDNVHAQNTYRLAKALQSQGKTFRMMLYPDKNHGIYGGSVRYQLYKTMTEFLTEIKNKK